jgi:hypothetical protein
MVRVQPEEMEEWVSGVPQTAAMATL